MIITEISVQKKNKKRSNVYIDGAYFCALDNFTVLKYSLKSGMEIEKEYLEEIQKENEKDKALNYAFDYISKYVKTEKQLKDKLYEKGYLTETVNYVLGKVKEYKYVDDESYAQNYLSYQKDKKGLKLIKYELKSKGIKEDIINNLEIEEDEEVLAAEKIVKKFFSKNEATKENLQKVYGKLIRGGFSYDVVDMVLRKVRKGEIEWK